MIYDIPHTTKFYWPSNLHVQWETYHLPPRPKNIGGGNVFLTVEWLEYIRAMNTPQAFQWMCGDSGTIIWGIRNKKNLAAKINRPKMPVIAIRGNKIRLLNVDANSNPGFGIVQGMSQVNYSVTPQLYPELWHRIWCVTQIRKYLTPPHDTPRGVAYLPILDVSAFKRDKTLAAGVTYCRIE